jgi:hypothetical protein
MDGVFIGALVLFTALILGLLAGCEKLAQSGRGDAHDLDALARGRLDGPAVRVSRVRAAARGGHRMNANDVFQIALFIVVLLAAAVPVART